MTPPMQTQWLKDARVQPYLHPVIRPKAASFVGGLVIEETKGPLADLRQARLNEICDSHLPNVTYAEHVDPTCNYAGGFDLRFGHLLAEFVHRIVPVGLAQPDLPWLIVGTDDMSRGVTFSQLPNLVRQVYEFFGLSENNARVITHPVRVPQLHVAPLGSHLGGKLRPGYLALLDRYSQNRLNALFGDTPRPAKVYVSRSEFLLGGFLGAKAVDQVFASAGFEVYHPQHHPLAEQLDVYRKAQHLVFDEGSAMHGLELLGSVQGSVGCLNRRPQAFKHMRMLGKTRSTHPWVFGRNAYVGSSSGSNRGITLFNLRELQTCLAQELGANNFAFDEDTYLAQAEQDFERYIAQVRRMPRKRSIVTHEGHTLQAGLPTETELNDLTRAYRQAVATCYG